MEEIETLPHTEGVDPRFVCLHSPEQGFVRHREGDYHPGPRTCRTAGALAADGWKYDDEGDVWRLPDPKKKGQNA